MHRNITLEAFAIILFKIFPVAALHLSAAKTHAKQKSAPTQTSAAKVFVVVESIVATTPTPYAKIPGTSFLHCLCKNQIPRRPAPANFTFKRVRFSKIHLSCLGAVMPSIIHLLYIFFGGINRCHHRIQLSFREQTGLMVQAWEFIF